MKHYSTVKQKRNTTAIVVIVFTILLLWGLWYFYSERQTHKKNLAEHELQLINQLQRNNIQLWREHHLINASHITEDSLFNSTINHWLNSKISINTKKSLQDHISRILRIMKEQRGYNAAYLVDMEGNIILDDLGETKIKLPDKELGVMHKTFEIAGPIAIEPRLDEFFSFPFFGVIAPIYDKNNNPIASVWLVTDVRKTLYTLIEKWPGNSDTAESNLIMQEGDTVLLLSPLRHAQSTNNNEENQVFSKAINGMHGLFDALDYRNQDVIATTTLINQSPWVLVSKIDTKEVFENSTQELLGLAAPVVLYLFIAAAGLVYVQRQGWNREKKLTLELENMVRVDALTNIANRLALDVNLNKEWDNAYRYNKPLSLLMIDIDFFKQFNDSYGHLEGDECLKHISKLLSGSVGRPSDLVARYGGEEFAILLPDTEAKNALICGQNICNRISEKNYQHIYSDRSKP